MNARLKHLLARLDGTLDSDREGQIEELHRRALSWEPVPRLPLITSYPAPIGEFAPYPHAETIDDPEKMLFNELVSAWGTSIVHRSVVGDDLPCTIRANFGTVLIASLFGATIEQVEQNPPWVVGFESREQFQAAMERDPLDFSKGWCPRVIERYEYYREVLDGYPCLLNAVKRVLPDLQGPMDTLEMLRGSGLYTDLMEDPEFVGAALSKIAAAQVGFARRLRPLLNDASDGWSHQHGFMIRGQILIRVDSAITVSPGMYRDQIAPHDASVLAELGGGGLHSCGNIDRHVSEYLSVPAVRCLDLGQPEMNNLNRLYELAREKGVALLRLSVPREQLITGSVARRFPTGVSLLYQASSVEDAREVVSAYQRACNP